MASGELHTIHTGTMFELKHMPVDGRDPYEFVTRRGATVVIPVLAGEDGGAYVVAATNERFHYGTSDGLPGGNADGTFDEPERPVDTGTRELAEEVGYVPTEGARISHILLPDSSTTIHYPRSIVVIRGVVYVGGVQECEHERVTPRLIGLGQWLDGLISLDTNSIWPETKLGFMKLVRDLGRDAVSEWLISQKSELDEVVANALQPWANLQTSASSSV